MVQQVKEQIKLKELWFRLILKDYLNYLRKDGNMVIGNPYVFSIMIDIVDEWNSDKSFNNGLLFMGINGVLIPKKITTATLNTEIFPLIRKLKNPMKNKDIFKMEKKEAFSCIYEQTFPSAYDVENDYSYYITPFEFENNNCLIFMVGDGEQIRILASEVEYIKEESTHNLQKLDVIETYISNEELEKIVEKLSIFHMNSR